MDPNLPNNPDINQPQVQTPKPKKNFSLAIMLSFTTILASLIAIFFYIQNIQLKKELLNYQSTPSPTPTPIDETVNWKTYQNEKYGYEIKYPQNLQPKETKNINYLNFVNFENVATDEANFSFNIGITTSTLENAIEKEKTATEGHVLVSLVSEKNLIVSGKPAVRLDWKPESPDLGKLTQVVVNNNKYSYLINLINSENNTIDQILSTFKFTDQGQGITYCQDPRPEVCTMECAENPPYICGSDGKSYCSICQACSNKKLEWYRMKNTPCEEK